MKQSKIALLIIVALLLGVTLVLGGSYVSANNYGARIEARLKAKHSDCKNILGQYTQKVQEAAQIPTMYRDDFKDVVTSALGSRYGKDGSQAMFQWLKEHNVNYDSSVYKKLQTMIEAGRNEFKNAQTGLLDIKRQYETSQNLFWRGMWLRVAGYPKTDLEDFNIVTTAHAENAFDKGVEEPVKLR